MKRIIGIFCCNKNNIMLLRQICLIFEIKYFGFDFFFSFCNDPVFSFLTLHLKLICKKIASFTQKKRPFQHFHRACFFKLMFSFEKNTVFFENVGTVFSLCLFQPVKSEGSSPRTKVFPFTSGIMCLAIFLYKYWN